MSETVVEVSTFTTNVVVPVATEKVTAASLKVPVQALSNRTKYLNDGLVLVKDMHIFGRWYDVGAAAPAVNTSSRFAQYFNEPSSELGLNVSGWRQDDITTAGRLGFQLRSLPNTGRITALRALVCGSGGNDPTANATAPGSVPLLKLWGTERVSGETFELASQADVWTTQLQFNSVRYLTWNAVSVPAAPAIDAYMRLVATVDGCGPGGGSRPASYFVFGIEAFIEEEP